MNKLFLLLSLSAMLFLGGCATGYTPSAETIASAHYGEKPIQYKSTIEEHVRDILIDPESARFSKYSQPEKNWIGIRPLAPKHIFGWLVCVDVNAKNRLGGYTGRERYFFVFQGEEIVYSYTGGSQVGIYTHHQCE